MKPEALQRVWTGVFRLSPHTCTTVSSEKEHVGEDLKKLSPVLKVWPPPLLCLSSLREAGQCWFGMIWPGQSEVKRRDGSGSETHAGKEWRMCRRWHTLTSRIPLNCYKLTPNPLRSTVNYLRSWQCRCPWHRLTKVLTEMCFILEEHLKCVVGVLAEAKIKSVCCVDGVDSNSRSLASLCFGCFLLFAFEDILSPPCCHTQTHFQGWSQQQNSTTKVKRVQRKPHRSTAFCIHPAFGASSRGAAVGQQSGPLPLLSTSRSSQVSHLQQQQVCLSSSVRGSGTSSATVPAWKVVEVNGNAAGLGERSLWRTPHENPTSSASTHDQTPRWCQALPRW